MSFILVHPLTCVFLILRSFALDSAAVSQGSPREAALELLVTTELDLLDTAHPTSLSSFLQIRVASKMEEKRAAVEMRISFSWAC